MDGKKTVFASKVVELSEHKSYIELVDRVCYYNAANANSVQLDYDESSLEKAQTLIGQPVLAKYLVDSSGRPTLGGHGVIRTQDGIKFSTSAIGVHTDVWIEDAEVQLTNGEVRTEKCLFAKLKLWNRFENMVSAVRRLFSEDRLHNSWEISVSSYKYENNTKKLLDYEFIGNALLGEAIPAYGSCSKVLTLSSLEDEDAELMVAEALTADMIASESASNINTNQLDNSESDRREEKLMEDKENVVVENSEQATEEETVEVVKTEETVEDSAVEEVNNENPEVSEGNSVGDEASATESEEEPDASEATQDETSNDSQEETSEMLTDRDIARKINEAYSGEGQVSMIFPEEKIVLIKRWGESDLRFKQFSYRIDNGKAVLENEKDVEFTISPLRFNSEIETKNNAIAEANNKIVALEAQVSELTAFKQELDAIKAEKEAAEHNDAIEKLRNYVVSSGRFTNEEIESDPVKSAIESLNESWIKSEVADRFIASLGNSNENNTEVSEVHTDPISIVLSEEDKPVTSEDVMRAFFND